MKAKTHCIDPSWFSPKIWQCRRNNIVKSASLFLFYNVRKKTICTMQELVFGIQRQKITKDQANFRDLHLVRFFRIIHVHSQTRKHDICIGETIRDECMGEIR